MGKRYPKAKRGGEVNVLYSPLPNCRGGGGLIRRGVDLSERFCRFFLGGGLSWTYVENLGRKVKNERIRTIIWLTSKSQVHIS